MLIGYQVYATDENGLRCEAPRSQAFFRNEYDVARAAFDRMHESFKGIDRMFYAYLRRITCNVNANGNFALHEEPVAGIVIRNGYLMRFIVE